MELRHLKGFVVVAEELHMPNDVEATVKQAAERAALIKDRDDDALAGELSPWAWCTSSSPSSVS